MLARVHAARAPAPDAARGITGSLTGLAASLLSYSSHYVDF
jgi:hypothetical protein